MRIGYARVSTEDQSLTLQLEQLKEAGCEKLYREKVSGKNLERPELERLLDQIRKGDILIVAKLDRLARSTRDLLEIMDRIHEAGATFLSLSEPWANTTTNAGKLIMTVFAGIAEFERSLILERTGTGREAARKNGVRFGRPPALNAVQQAAALGMLDRGDGIGQVAEVFQVHRETIRRLRQRQEAKT